MLRAVYPIPAAKMTARTVPTSSQFPVPLLNCHAREISPASASSGLFSCGKWAAEAAPVVPAGKWRAVVMCGPSGKEMLEGR